MPAKRKIETAIQSGSTLITPLKKSRTDREMRSNGPKGSDSETDQSSGSDIEMATATNQDLLVSAKMSETRTGKEIILISISNARPATSLGKKQGDHVTAYQTFLEMLVTSISGYKVKQTQKILVNVAKAILPDQREIFDDYLAKKEKEKSEWISKEERKEILSALKKGKIRKPLFGKAKKTLVSEKRTRFMRAVEEIIQLFITRINLDEDVAFKRVKQVDSAEGARVKKAIHALRIVNELRNYTDRATRVSVEQLNDFWSIYIQRGSRFRDGANYLFTSKLLEKHEKRWGKTSLKEKRDLLKSLGGVIDAEKIGDLIGELFDFSHVVHKEQPLNILYKVVAKHLVIILNAFDNLSHWDASKIADSFIQRQVLDAQEWKNYTSAGMRLKLGSIRSQVNKIISLKDKKMLSEEERRPEEKKQKKSRR